MGEKFYAANASDLASRETLLSMSGLEFLRATLDGDLPQPAISRTLNYWLHAVGDGRVAFRGQPEFAHTNPVHSVHGGWYATLLDSAMACAVMTRVPRGSAYTTLEFKVNIIRPIPLGTLIEAVGVTSHAGRSTGIAEGRIEGVVDGRLYATGSTTCIIMKMD